jgi:aminodeoxychorismate lyase
MMHFNYNGKIYAANTPVFGPSNRGVRYGDGIFETMKLLNGNLLFADNHFARLWKGLQLLQFDIPKHFSPELLQESILSLAKKNKHQAKARVRLTIVRGNGGLYDAENNTPHYCIETWALQTEDILNTNGLVAGIYDAVKKTTGAISNCKHNNYLPYAMAALHAKKQKWNDAIVLNSYGNICDSTIANIFYIKDAVIYTPALSEGCVAGVMREHILQQLRDNGYTCKETTVTVNDILQADEVFVTNATYNMRWIKQIDNASYKNELVQKIYNTLLPTFT